MASTERDAMRDGPSLSGEPDPQMKAVLDKLASLGGKPIETLSAEEARQQPTPADAVKAVLEDQGHSTDPDPSVEAEDRTIPGPVGQIPITVYTPRQGEGPWPLVVYYHGGGWVIADRKVYDAGPRALAGLANAVVVSVDYRQGPEDRFPAAHDDAFGAYRWALDHGNALRADVTRVGIAGESAGGGLAVATAIAARDAGVPMPQAIVSVYPIVGTDTSTPSYLANAEAKPLNRPMMEWFFEKYLSGPADRSDPRVDLVNADLSGLPRTTILNAQIDPLRSEGETLADRLEAAGVEVDQKTYAGVTHEFFGMGAVVGTAREAQQRAAAALMRAFQQ